MSPGPVCRKKSKRPWGWEIHGAEPGGLTFVVDHCDEEERAARTFALEGESRNLLGSKVYCTFFPLSSMVYVCHKLIVVAFLQISTKMFINPFIL